MPRGATPSRWCVCQFHHFGFFNRALRGWRSPSMGAPIFTSSVRPEPAQARPEEPARSAEPAQAAADLAQAAAGLAQAAADPVEPAGPVSPGPQVAGP